MSNPYAGLNVPAPHANSWYTKFEIFLFFLALRPQLEHWNTMLMESIMIHSQNLIKCMLALLPLLILNFVPFVLQAF